MKQILVLKDRNDILNSLIGRTFDQKLKDEAYEMLVEIHKGYFGSGLKCLVYNVDVKTNKVLGVGGSSLLQEKKTGKIYSDLITENFLKFFGAIMGGLTGGDRAVNLRREASPFGFNVHIYDDANPHDGYNQSTLGGFINVGDSATAPTRTDERLNSKFVTSPESLLKTFSNPNSGAPYNSGTGKIFPISTTIFPTGGSGTIRESGCYLEFVPTTGSSPNFMVAHDLISPTVAFVAGQAITIEYTWQI